jgi:hypothetical protein
MMKKDLGQIQVIGLAALLALLARVDSAQALEPDPAVAMTFTKMVNAIKTNDRKAFVAEATLKAKNATTPEIIEELHKQLGPRLTKGYDAIYLAQLKQGSYVSHLWKLAFKDQGDDILVRLVLKNGKVEAFLLQ